MISRTTASTPPLPPPPVSTMVVCSRSTSGRSSAIGNSPCFVLLLERNEPVEDRVRARTSRMRGGKSAAGTAWLLLCAGNQAAQQQPNVVQRQEPSPVPPPGTG